MDWGMRRSCVTVTASGACHPAMRSQRISALWCAPITGPRAGLPIRRRLLDRPAGRLCLDGCRRPAWRITAGDEQELRRLHARICEYWPSGLPSVHRGAHLRHRPHRLRPIVALLARIEQPVDHLSPRRHASAIGRLWKKDRVLAPWEWRRPFGRLALSVAFRSPHAHIPIISLHPRL
jgi:hypothetical protein